MPKHYPPKEKLHDSGNKFGDISAIDSLPEAEIGVIRGGKKKPIGIIDIATYQRLINKKYTIPSLPLFRTTGM